VQVESGKSTVVNTALDEDAGQALAEVVVTAERPTNTEVSLISEIKTAQTIATGVSAEQIVRTQDRDAAQVARRVPAFPSWTTASCSCAASRSATTRCLSTT
jgi:hypothetical protein